MIIILTIHNDIKMFHFKQIEGFKIKKNMSNQRLHNDD